ncbi:MULTISPECIES: hypothetical protein [Lactobacillales]|uniref:DUF4064 domain-containing protein n=1 Tax=Enterococcus aquimarinus TaxID=328396 RepID=A0A1L8QTA1_9ENTE|nr:hypothetical protein [Enterococcus aquimarinus]OJG10738.1 hypothetical protein RU93_GL001951 [Enterococcus aquimarinus]
MKRRIERITLFLAALWNIITATLTIVGYSNWFKNEGITAFEEANQVNYISTSLLDSLINIIMVYGLLILTMGIINLFITKQLERERYNKKTFIWLLICLLIQFLSFDVIGVLLYIVTITLYSARNRAYKVATN